MTVAASAVTTADAGPIADAVTPWWLDTGPGPSATGVSLRLPSRLDATAVTAAWDAVHALASGATAQGPVVLDASGVDYCDGAGLALLASIGARDDATGVVRVDGLRERFRALLDRLDALDVRPCPVAETAPAGLVEVTGEQAAVVLKEAAGQLEFIGAVTRELALAVVRPGRVRWGEVLAVAREAGANAVGIVSLLAFLLGLILAFESAVPLRRFGAEVFVANLLGLALLRELGPLITAILLSARSGAAFAAEFGAMKVNQEVDALVTMGLSPLRFFVLPRVIATAFVAPLLTAFANLVGLIGGAVTMLAFQIPMSAFWRQVLGAVHLGDLVIGLVKAAIFGIVIAAAGCFRGGQTASGAGAVGRATTSAVVTCIVLLVVIDGAIALVLYAVGL